MELLDADGQLRVAGAEGKKVVGEGGDDLVRQALERALDRNEGQEAEHLPQGAPGEMELEQGEQEQEGTDGKPAEHEGAERRSIYRGNPLVPELGEDQHRQQERPEAPAEMFPEGARRHQLRADVAVEVPKTFEAR